jgi:hypothetical protein
MNILFLWLILWYSHDFHTSLAEVNFNSRKNTWEVSVRMFTDDLEEASGKHNQVKVTIDKTKNSHVYIEKYLKEKFNLIDKKGKKANFTWVGKEIEADVTWVYFELSFSKKTIDFELKNNIMLELFDDQLNLNNFNYQGKKKTFICQKGTEKHSVNFSK